MTWRRGQWQAARRTGGAGGRRDARRRPRHRPRARGGRRHGLVHRPQHPRRAGDAGPARDHRGDRRADRRPPAARPSRSASTTRWRPRSRRWPRASRPRTGRLDILVNDIWGGDELIDWGAKFWKQDMAAVRTLVDQAVLSHLITARHFAPMMVEANRGLIVEVTDGQRDRLPRPAALRLRQGAVNRLAYAMAWDLARTGVTALALSPGLPALRGDARALRRHRGQLARRRRATTRLRLLGDAALRRPRRRRARRRSGGAAQGRRGALRRRPRRRIRLHRRRRPRPHFPRSTGAQLDAELAKDGPLGPWATLHAANRYMRSHLDPAAADHTRRLAARLGWTRLGQGLQPIGE